MDIQWEPCFEAAQETGPSLGFGLRGLGFHVFLTYPRLKPSTRTLLNPNPTSLNPSPLNMLDFGPELGSRLSG